MRIWNVTNFDNVDKYFRDFSRAIRFCKNESGEFYEEIEFAGAKSPPERIELECDNFDFTYTYGEWTIKAVPVE